jgi:ribose transport system ATP-binding protein
MTQQPLLQLESITKSYDGNLVLDRIDFELKTGELRLLVGENGAGKSTLVKIVTGATSPDSGCLFWKGGHVSFTDTRQAQDLGIRIVHQELNLVPQLSIVENIFLGRYPLASSRLGWIDWNAARSRARQLLAMLDLRADVETLVGQLGVAEQQLVEIAKAIAFDAELLVLDEPTATLTPKETARLLKIMADLKQRNVAMIYISHRLTELGTLADTLTILRDGRHVTTKPAAESTVEQVIQWMVGRELNDQFPEPSVPQQSRVELLRVEELRTRQKFSGVSFSITAGEILGLAGLVGSGRTDLARALFGADPFDSGTVYWKNRPVKIQSPADAIRLGIGLLTEDRKAQGLIGSASITINTTLASGEALTHRLFLFDTERALSMTGQQVRQLRIKSSGLDQPVRFLSGGNQQKVVLGRWLCLKVQLLIMDEPARGIDVGAKAEIYQLIRDLADQGVAILLISSQMEEILGLCDRVLVMRSGKLQGEVRRRNATQEGIMALATGQTGVTA